MEVVVTYSSCHSSSDSGGGSSSSNYFVCSISGGYGGSNDDITRTCLPTAVSSGGFSSSSIAREKNKASVNTSYTYTIHSCLFEASHLLSLNRLTWWPEHPIQKILEVTGRPSSGGQ